MTITGSSSSLYDLRDYVHRCVLTEPRPRDETFNLLDSCDTIHASFPPDRVFTYSQEAGLERYAIAGKETDWDDALVGKKVPKSGMLSVKRKHGDGADASTPEKKSSKKDKKGDKGHKMKGAKTPKSSSKKSKHKA